MRRHRPVHRASRVVSVLIPVSFVLALAPGCASGGDQVTAGSSTSSGAVSSTSVPTSSALSSSTSTTASSTTAPPSTAPPTAPTSPPATSAPVTVPPTNAGDGSLIATFLSPSRNIACQLFVQGGGGEVRCDIRQATFTPPQPAEPCDLDYGDSIVLTTFAEFGCHGDTVFDPGGQVLGYGQRMEVGSFRCDSERIGVTCTNLATGRGFSIRRASYRLF